MPAQRARQARPTQAELRNYWRLLKDKADEGDTLAAGLLLMNDTVASYFDQERSDRLEREAEQEGGTVKEILGRGRRRLLDLIDQIERYEEDQPRDAAGELQQGQGPRDAAPAETTGQAGSASGGDPVSGVRDSRRDLGDEHPTQADKET